MKNKSSIIDRLNNTKPIDSEVVNKAIQSYNADVEADCIKIQKQNRESEVSATQARITI